MLATSVPPTMTTWTRAWSSPCRTSRTVSSSCRAPPTTTFTQADVTNGFVTFVHDGGEIAPSYDVEVSDGNTSTATATATITFSANVDDTPVLGSNSLTVNEGQTVVLAAGDLSASDDDDLDPGLVFTVSNVTNGQFELTGAPTTTFTQADVTSGFVTFVHDGGEIAPSYDVEVSDGDTSTAPAAATITFSANVDDTPVLGNNSLTVNEGQTVVLDAGDLGASDDDDLDPGLVFTVSNVTNGQFELSGAPTTTFTQADITNGFVTFVHDGGEIAPELRRRGQRWQLLDRARRRDHHLQRQRGRHAGAREQQPDRQRGPDGRAGVPGTSSASDDRRPGPGPDLHGLERHQRPV